MHLRPVIVASFAAAGLLLQHWLHLHEGQQLVVDVHTHTHTTTHTSTPHLLQRGAALGSMWGPHQCLPCRSGHLQ